MRKHTTSLLALMLLAAIIAPARGQEAPAPAEAPRAYVPYADLAAIVDPTDKAVLMDRTEFDALLAAARARDAADPSRPVAEIVRARYDATVRGDRAELTGELTVTSLTDEPITVYTPFAHVGITELALNGKPAPMNYDAGGRLVLIVTGKGDHTLTVRGLVALREMERGGMQMSVTLPPPVAGEMTLRLPGDQEAHANVPVASTAYDKAADRTTVRLAIGGQGTVSVALLGNGRREDEQPILLGESATTVTLTPTSQVLNCLYTVQVLRRGVRELTFTLDPRWTITDVASPSLVKWSVERPEGEGPQRLIVRLRSASRGTQGLHLQASAPREGEEWTAPRIALVNADYQRGYLLADPGPQLTVRREAHTHARRQDIAAAVAIPGLTAATGRLYFHWGDDWTVQLALSEVALRRLAEARQQFTIAPTTLTLRADVRLTPVGREMFDAAVLLPPTGSGWDLDAVYVDGRTEGFQYRLTERGGERRVQIDLSAPVRSETATDVTLILRHTPADWAWSGETMQEQQRTVRLPLLRPVADSLSGLASVTTTADLDASVTAPDAGELAPVPVGRMGELGLGADVVAAWTYESAPAAALSAVVTRKDPRISAQSVGLVSLRTTGVSGLFQLDYTISRAGTRTLYVLTDKSLQRRVELASTTHRIVSRDGVESGPDTVELDPAAARANTLWRITLDRDTIGLVTVLASYQTALPGSDPARQQRAFSPPAESPEQGQDAPATHGQDARATANARPADASAFALPLVRPVASSPPAEFLALQGEEELAVHTASAGMAEIDTLDLPPLPQPASRLLGAYRVESGSPDPALRVRTEVHDRYDVPTALVLSANLTTYVGTDASQQTEARLRLVNAGLQFLTVALPPETTEVWSVRVAGEQSKITSEGPGVYRITVPLSRTPIEVALVYATKPTGSLAALDLVAPALTAADGSEVRINQVAWSVVPPAGHVVDARETHLASERPRAMRWQPALFQTCDEVFGIGRLALMPGVAFCTVRSEEMAEGSDQRTLHIQDGARSSGEFELLDQPRNGREVSRRRELSPQAGEQGQQQGQQAFAGAGRFAHRVEGRFTLPVTLYASPDAVMMTRRFTGLGAPQLEVRLTPAAFLRSPFWIAFALTLLVGALLLNVPPGRKALFVFLVLLAATLVAIWAPPAALAANGAFYAALLLVPAYLAIGIVRTLARWVRGWGRKSAAPTVPSTVIVLLALAAAAILAPVPALAADRNNARAQAPNAPVQIEVQQAEQESLAPQLPQGCPAPEAQVLVLPYDGDPTAVRDSAKVLVPYARFVELWNLAHPEQRLTPLPPGTDLSLADVRYDAVLKDNALTLTLTAQVVTRGEGWVLLPMPFDNLAVTQAKLNGEPAQLQVGPKGMVLMLGGGESGRLEVQLATTPQATGRKGSVRISLPPLPAGVMTVRLGAEDLELDLPGSDLVVHRMDTPQGPVSVVPLGMTRELTLAWSPRSGAGAADKTLSAATEHNVHAFHWALVGVSHFTWSFSAGEHDRFALLVPASGTLTALDGPNLRDWRVTGRQTVEGREFDVVEVRLHRPATRQYALTARWASPLPALDEPHRLWLPRTADVGRESGALHLHEAGGMTVRVTGVEGGRLSQTLRDTTALRLADTAAPVATYYWPYRPFAITVQLSRRKTTAHAHLDQLVRIAPDTVQLLTDAKLTADDGLLFGTSLLLPDGYELLSVVGPTVEDWHVQEAAAPAPRSRVLHVNFRSGVTSTKLAVVLLREGRRVERLAVPVLLAADPEGKPLGDQTGRLAVQVEASLDSATAASENLRSLAPQKLQDWLEPAQRSAVRFAYQYEGTGADLALTVTPKPTRVRVELLTGLAVYPTHAGYTYRLRYTIDGSPLDRVSFTLPRELTDRVAVDSPSLRSVRHEPAEGGRTRWTVALVNELTGVLDVTVNFTLPLDAQTPSLPVPRLETEAPDGYRAILAVQNLSRHELSLQTGESLRPVAVSEQQAILDEPIRGSLQYVRQAFEPDWSAQLQLTYAKDARRVQAIVDLMDVTTVIDLSGQCRYQVRLSLQNRTEQFLRLQVPEGLSLWSARVADQPVRPVLPADGQQGEVLIPLVKTSLGDLPYDVTLYLAGRPSQGVEAMGRIEPPLVRVVGVPVRQMTWSLRLPQGFRYVRPEGNMSAIAGFAEVKTIEIETRLVQIKRMADSYSRAESKSGKASEAFSKNWQAANAKLAQEIEYNRRFLEYNRNKLGDEKFKELQRKNEDNANSQYGLLQAWNQEQQSAQSLHGSNNINDWGNYTAANPGRPESDRNGAVRSLPGFVAQAQQGQLTVIQQEMVSNTILLNNAGNVISGINNSPAGMTPNYDFSSVALGNNAGIGLRAGDLLRETDGDLAERLGGLHQSVQREQARQLAVRQDQLEQQMQDLGENRLQRYYTKGGKGAADMPAPAQPSAPPPALATGQRRDGRDIPLASQPWEGVPATTGTPTYTLGATVIPGQARHGQVTGSQDLGATVTLGDAVVLLNRTNDFSGDITLGDGTTHIGGSYSSGTIVNGGVGGVVLNQANTWNGNAEVQDGGMLYLGGGGGMLQADGTVEIRGRIVTDDVGVGSGSGYVPAGTFSLPVSLPEDGHVRLDFAFPGGEGKVSVLAVPERAVEASQDTAVVLALAGGALLLAFVLRRVRRRFARR